MRLVQLFLLFMFGLFLRRSLRAFGRRKSDSGASGFKGQGRENPGGRSQPPTEEPLRDITEQEIDDADFEEIP